MAATKKFPLGDILSIVTGRIIVPQQQGDREIPKGIREFIIFMKGESFTGHSMQCRDECRASLRTQLPQLHTSVMQQAISALDRQLAPTNDFAEQQKIKRIWLMIRVSRYGKTLPVKPIT